jgi:hypothetical protein
VPREIALQHQLAAACHHDGVEIGQPAGAVEAVQEDATTTCWPKTG